jgi:choline kinase
MDGPELVEQYIAVIIAEVKSSSRELYPLTKNYPMCLLPVGTKKLIIYQLESLLSIKQLASNFLLN